MELIHKAIDLDLKRMCCHLCPFKNGDELDSWCNMSEDIASCGPTSTTYTEGELPETCPLKKGPILISLK